MPHGRGMFPHVKIPGSWCAGKLCLLNRNRLYVVQRELSEVNLAVLRVAKFYAVIYHSGMVGTHGPYVYSLDASHSAIVFHLHSREVTQCVGHAVAVQAL